MSRFQTLDKIIDCGVVAVIRVDSSDELLNIAKALKDGGVIGIELTMTTSGALNILPEIKKQMGKEIVLGVGTVLDPETARMAILAGADFIVSPILKPEIIKICHSYDKVVIPGAYTPTEILRAWEEGADVVKLFPAESLGPSYIKAIHGPMPYIRISPTGGVSLENVGEFIKAGACFVGVGGNLVDKKAVKEQKFEIITQTAKAFVEEVKKARI
ncbi:MAG: 2-dehydro-3-deoxyphosphogluconate aldolase [Dictyoglomus sp. NZ13-RE01]|nr:MAG: 2-dehydro-3-deoxyphosphogluconate aldolase [Dictyoglomus sp. NZ13-RE01]